MTIRGICGWLARGLFASARPSVRGMRMSMMITSVVSWFSWRRAASADCNVRVSTPALVRHVSNNQRMERSSSMIQMRFDFGISGLQGQVKGEAGRAGHTVAFDETLVLMDQLLGDG